MEEIKKQIQNLNLKTRLHDESEGLQDENKFRDVILESFDKLMSLKDSCVGKKAIVMGLGPSLLEIDKKKFSDKDTIKIVCNSFYRVSNFFVDDFVPDFWCGANSYEWLEEPYEYCIENNITPFITIPKKSELEKFISFGDQLGSSPIVWLWEHKIFQQMLAKKYGIESTYTHCNTITNHMIAFALWLGCNPIYVTGFDMSYAKSLKDTGKTHAHDTEDGEVDIYAFDYASERDQIIRDLKYLCKIAYNNDIEIHNLSHEQNKLPYNLSFRK